YKKIYYKNDNIVAAEIDVNTQSDENNVEAWHVSQAFINSIISMATQNHIKVTNNNTDEMQAQAKMVDALFEIDKEGFIKQRFIELFKQDSEEVEN
ncbi:MAG: hypothetical protein E7I84_12490, partial [Staphylococcus warneri]|nr:hypothetical protein [Staphylococcus warneri]